MQPTHTALSNTAFGKVGGGLDSTQRQARGLIFGPSPGCKGQTFCPLIA